MINKKHIITNSTINTDLYIDDDRYIIISEDEINKHYDDAYSFILYGRSITNNIKVGQFILYEKLNYAGYYSDFPRNWDLSYPEVGVIIYSKKTKLGSILRVKELKTDTTFDLTYGLFDNHIIIDIWDNKPNFRELKAAYNKTLWYRKSTQEKRNLIINNILK